MSLLCDKNKESSVFGLKFRLLMGYHDMTLKDIATYTNNAVSTVGTWKNGKIPSSMSSVEKLSKLFGVSVSYILNDNIVSPLSDDSNLNNYLTELIKDKDDKNKSDKNLQSSNTLDKQITEYFFKFVDIARDHTYGMEYLFIRLRKEFPLDLFDNLK